MEWAEFGRDCTEKPIIASIHSFQKGILFLRCVDLKPVQTLLTVGLVLGAFVSTFQQHDWSQQI